jgi:hypothetical protein
MKKPVISIMYTEIENNNRELLLLHSAVSNNLVNYSRKIPEEL